jgi:V/A-type H+-transporting ATPase subunit G/H
MISAFDEIKQTEEQAEKMIEDAKIKAAKLKRAAKEEGEKLIEASRKEAENEGEKIIKKQISEAENEAKEIGDQTKLKIKDIFAIAKDKADKIKRDLKNI